MGLQAYSVVLRAASRSPFSGHSSCGPHHMRNHVPVVSRSRSSASLHRSVTLWDSVSQCSSTRCDHLYLPLPAQYARYALWSGDIVLSRLSAARAPIFSWTLGTPVSLSCVLGEVVEVVATRRIGSSLWHYALTFSRVGVTFDVDYFGILIPGRDGAVSGTM